MQIHISNTLINIHMFTLAKINTGLITKKKQIKMVFYGKREGMEFKEQGRK